MALTALNLAALPVIAGLMAGTGAMAAYVTGPVSTPAAASAPASVAPTVAAPQTKPCEAQTWPYIEGRCVATGVRQNRKVRLVMAPRNGVSDVAAPEAVDATPAAAPRMDAPAPPEADKLVTRDTVGRSVGTVSPATIVAPPASRRVEKRRVREERKVTREAYQVPSEVNARHDSRPVIVVRPLRLDTFR